MTYLIQVNLITAANLFYHKKFYTKHSSKYQRAKNGNDNGKNTIETKKTNKKEQVFQLLLEECNLRINKEMGFTLTGNR